MKKRIAIVGIASGWGAPDQRTANGPDVIMAYLKSTYPDWFYSYTSYHSSEPLPEAAKKPLSDYEDRHYHVTRMVTELAHQIETLVRHGYFPIVLGGDHSIAIGTWSGMKRCITDFSLLWFDAHMDAHTNETSESLAPHGMPVASLLGHGSSEWADLNQQNCPTLKPENLYQFGIRSFEDGESSLLKKKNVSIYYADDCKQDELQPIIQSVITNLKTQGFGISIDIDAFDPSFAPGTGTTEPNGLNPNAILAFLADVKENPNCLALEIMEFNPDKDIDHKTFDWIIKFIETIANTNS